MHDGPDLLRAALDNRNQTYIKAELALGLKSRGAYVSRLIGRQMLPSLRVAARIREVYGIPESAWSERRNGRAA